MDPNVTFRLMLESFAESEYEFAAESAASLLKWLRRGGFPPTVSIVGGGELLELETDQANRAIAFAVASEIQRKAESESNFS